MMRAGGATEAEKNYRRALTIADKLVDEYLNVPYYGILQAFARNRLGGLLVLTDRLEEGEPLLRQVATIVDASRGRHVRPGYFPCVAAASHQYLALARIYAGRPDEAETEYRQAVSLRMRVARDYPFSGPWHSVANTTHQLASVLSQRGLTDAAIDVHRNHVEFWKEQAVRHPDNPLVLRARGWSLNHLGSFLQSLGQWDQADEAYREAQESPD